MNDEIKFKRYLNNIFVGIEWHRHTDLSDLHSEMLVYYQVPEWGKQWYAYENINDVPKCNRKEQFTGYHDRNGGEIYFGDKLKFVGGKVKLPGDNIYENTLIYTATMRSGVISLIPLSVPMNKGLWAPALAELCKQMELVK
jgi:hypothetical protein